MRIDGIPGSIDPPTASRSLNSQLATTGLPFKQPMHHQYCLCFKQSRKRCVKKKHWHIQTSPHNNLFVCVRAQTRPTWHVMSQCHCGGAAKAPAPQRFMPTGVCWNPGCLVQPSCMGDKTRGPAADISIGHRPSPPASQPPL